MPEGDSVDATAQLAAGLLGKSPLAQPQGAPAPATPGVTGKEPEQAQAIDPETVKALGSDFDSFKSNVSGELGQLKGSLQQIMGAVQQLADSREEQGLKLDPDELKNLSMGEAMEAVGNNLSERTEKQLKRLLRPFVGDLLNTRVQTELLMAKEMYPGFSIAKHAAKFQSERASNPDAAISDIVQRIATKDELAATPKTPTPQDEQVHMESGPGATSPGVPARGTSDANQGYTAAEQNTLHAALNRANVEGNSQEAERYAAALLADRLLKTGGIPTGR